MSTGILGTRATWVADVNLILQVAMFLVLLFAALQAKRRNLELHRTLMIALVVTNAVAIIAIMNPSFFRSLPYALSHCGARGPRILWPHVAVGTVAELMGIYFVIVSKGGTSIQLARERNLGRVMRITVLLWTVSLVLGVMSYCVRYM